MSFPWAKSYQPKHPVMIWLDERLPLPRFIYSAIGGGYPVPRNLNFMWSFGFLAGLALVIQIITGIVLAMHFVGGEGAFNAVEYGIMRQVNSGWLIRYMHATGATFFFAVIYMHIFRGLYFGSYKAPREMVWILGVLIFLLMMATAFMGYGIVGGNMSFWGVKVITGFFSAIPIVGESIQHWLLGSFAPDEPAFTRFFALHYLMPFVIMGVVILHIWALHIPGSNNPEGIDVKNEEDTVPFHPYYTAKDGFALSFYLTLFAFVLFFAPNLVASPDNYVAANNMTTPAHIEPEWYFWPFYAILRAFTWGLNQTLSAKLFGVLAMFGSIALLFFMPWLDTSSTRSAKYRPLYKKFYWALVVDVLVLGFCGMSPAEQPYIFISQVAAIYYFLHFLVIIPVISRIEKPLPVPNSITEAVLAKAAAQAEKKLAQAAKKGS